MNSYLTRFKAIALVLRTLYSITALPFNKASAMIRINESSLSLSEAIRAITPTGSARSKITPRLAELVATFPVSRLMVVINSNSKSVKRISIISKLPCNLNIEFHTRFCYE